MLSTHPSFVRRLPALLGAATLALATLLAPAGAQVAGATGASSRAAGALAMPAAASATAPLPFVPYNEARPVLAYYYTWWGPGDFSNTLYQPTEAYNSDDAAVMQRHIQQAQAAGIDGFVVSWLGAGNRTDQNLAKLMDLAQQSGFRASVHFETPLFAPYGPGDVVAQLRELYRTRLSHPAVITYQGRPVIFFWRAGIFDNGTWSAIRAEVDPERRAVWIADGDQFGILAGDAWDGISPYAIAWSGSPGVHLQSWAAKAAAVAPEKLYIPPVSPGCDDSAARAATCIQGRQDGAYYQATLDGAMAVNPPWAVMVSTFNEWKESTQIEPGTAYGDQYLQMTRAFADAYKGSSAAPAFQPVAEEPAPEELAVAEEPAP